MKIYRAHITGPIVRRFRRLFPERQVFLRSRGEVRFLRLSPALQAGAAGVLLLLGGWIVAISFDVLTGDLRLAAKERELVHISGEVGTLLAELDRLQDEALERAERLEARQKLIDELVDPEAVIPATDTAPFDAEEEAPSPAEHSFRIAPDAPKSLFSSVLGAGPARAGTAPPTSLIDLRTERLIMRLRRLETEQERIAETLLAREEVQLGSDIAVVDRLGLTLAELLGRPQGTGSALGSGVGGPFVTPEGAILADSFERLAGLIDLRRDFNRAIASVPSAVPAGKYYISSRYGPRRDPFRKSWAMHSGVDLAGWPGEPILAAGGGRIVKAGRAPAYGLMVEIDHGNGFRTRYGHMRKLAVKAGEEVARGEKVGEMGSTGRSTSTHLHLEIWFRGQLVDPLPYLEASEDVFSIQRQGRVGEG